MQARTAQRRAPARHPVAGRAISTATPRQDAVSVVIGAWLVAALFSDGWAHANVPELEGFFTPWHGALYLSLAASAAWIAWLSGAARTRGWSPAVPLGYRGGALGVAVFALGGVLDMAWHLLLGVEVGVGALLSPSHLVLLGGGMLIVTSPVRSRWGAGDGGSPVTVAALALATALGAFFLLYVSEFVAVGPTVAYEQLPEGAPGHQQAELPALVGQGAFLVTTAVVLTPLLLAWQRGRAPRGLTTAVVTLVAWLSAAVAGMTSDVVVGALGATFGALVADLVVGEVERRRQAPATARLPLLAAVSVGTVWSTHVAALAWWSGLRWPPELWSGVVVLAVGFAALLGLVAQGGRTASGRDDLSSTTSGVRYAER